MLTKKQKELFVYLSDYISSNDISPSFEEMKNAVNLKSKSGIHRLITSLEQRGYIKRLKHKARAMEITKELPNINPSITNSEENFLNIPLVGSIAAGEAIEAISTSDSMISVPKSLVTKHSTYFGLKVRGLSMIDEGIFDGDIAIIKKTTSAENGKIAAVLTLDNEITLKKIKMTNQKIYLIPANKAYDIKEHDIGDVQIQGTLSGIIRKYN
ncbi:MAG: transcriptional repressor LexA [Pelagibacteraceae bacterium]|nr:transcriptional repressor LexA [Pelagibacteraceae bacterium]MBT6197731.1 transcriptional repressor LexA [Pelagibacteraceae bacterium]MBT6354532.1 transcriptional repressor LexA [Pelagibacteraceae bacterium]